MVIVFREPVLVGTTLIDEHGKACVGGRRLGEKQVLAVIGVIA